MFLTQFSPVIWGQGSGRTWTSVDGATIEAEMMGVRGENIVVQQGSRRLDLSFTTLSKRDLNFIYGWLQAAVKNQNTSGYPLPTLDLKKEKRGRSTIFSVNGVRQMSTDVFLRSTVVAPFFSDTSRLHLRMIEPKSFGEKIDRATIKSANQIKPTVIPSLPRTAYLKIADNLAASVAATAKPLAWEADGNLVAESAERLRLVQETIKNVETSSLIRYLLGENHPMGILPDVAVKRTDREIRFQPNSEYWLPELPKNANRTQCEQAYARWRDAMREIRVGARFEPTQFKWKAVSADARLLEGVFRQCCGFLHEWHLCLETVKMNHELYIELKDGDLFYYQKTTSE